MDLGSWSKREMEELARIYQGFSHPARIAVLVAIDSGLNLNEASEFLGIKRPSLQDHVDKLVEAELVFRPSDGATYKHTPLGNYFMDRLTEERESLLDALDLIDSEEEDLWNQKTPDQKELEEYDVPIDEGKLERQIHTQKWEKLSEKIDELLNNQ